MAPTPLCDWTRTQMKEERELMLRIKLDPRFECRKCHRWASDRQWLCEPEPLKATTNPQPVA